MKILKTYTINSLLRKFELYNDFELISICKPPDPVISNLFKLLQNIRYEAFMVESYKDDVLIQIKRFQNDHISCDCGPAIIDYDKNGNKTYQFMINSRHVIFPENIKSYDDKVIYIKNYSLLS